MKNTDKGYIKLRRSSQDNRLYFAEPFTRWQAWVDLILIANHCSGFFYVRGNKVEVGRGQVGMSEDTLARRRQWSRGKVRRFISDLESRQQIVQQKNRVMSVITIVNYNRHQGSSTTDSTTDGQQTVQQTDTNKNDKNVKEGKESNILPKKKKKVVVVRSEEEAVNYIKTKSNGYDCDTIAHKKCVVRFFMTGYEYRDDESLKDVDDWLQGIAIEYIGRNQSGDIPRATMTTCLNTYLDWQKESAKGVSNVKSSIRNGFNNKRIYKG